MKNDKETDLINNGNMLPLAGDFYSIQGEGYHAGKPAFFIRIAGCDIGCEWCDEKEAWDPSSYPLINISEIIKRAIKYPAKAIVVTGGEPLLYDLKPLCDGLKAFKISTYLETSGTRPLTGRWDWICLSPKKEKPPLKEISRKADELKVVICEESDLGWAEESEMKVGNTCRLYLQPEWSRQKDILPVIIDYVKSNPVWSISLQVHKYMNIL